MLADRLVALPGIELVVRAVRFDIGRASISSISVLVDSIAGLKGC